MSGFWGGRFERAFLMSEFLILMPDQTANKVSQPLTENMKASSNEHMSRGGAWILYPMHLSCRLLEVWAELPLCMCYIQTTFLYAGCDLNQPYSSTINWLRCRLCFSLLRTSIQCIHVAHSTSGHASKFITPPTDFVGAEANMVF